MTLYRFVSRRNAVFAHDLFMAAVSFVVALFLRLGWDLSTRIPASEVLTGMVVFVALCALIFRWQGLYRGVWRYASLRDLIAISRAVSLSVLLFVPVMFLLTRLETLPRSLPIINWFVLMALLGGPRFIYRIWRDHNLETMLRSTEREPVLVAGTGDGAELFLRAMTRSPLAEYQVVGLLAEKPHRVGMDIHGAPVLGQLGDLAGVVNTLGEKGLAPTRLVLSRDDMDRKVVAELFEQAQTLGLSVARLPKMTELREGLTDEVALRPVAIEDLLGRPQASLDREAMGAMIRGRRVLITGAGGSIGSELARQVAALGPSVLTLAENSEYALYSIDLELGERFSQVARWARLLDIRDEARLEQVFAEAKPELVFHAAALKHVPMVEANPVEGIRTNTLGTRAVADACRRHGVAQMVLISTDKAVNPTNVMGSAKRMAELYCQAMDVVGREQGGTRFVTVRFGNVLGSTGSVVPLFQRQLSRGGPLTVTHPDMTRYFMTIREAVELVLEAAALGVGDETAKGRIFVLDMGEPVKIVDLARQMIRLAGRKPGEDVKIEFTGLRPGEKLFEEIFHGAEAPVPTAYEGLLLATPRVVAREPLEAAFAKLEQACCAGDRDAALDVLHALVPEYRRPEIAPGSRTIAAH